MNESIVGALGGQLKTSELYHMNNAVQVISVPRIISSYLHPLLILKEMSMVEILLKDLGVVDWNGTLGGGVGSLKYTH